MRSVYKKGLITIALLLVLCGVVGTNYLFYDKSIGSEMIVEANGELSINYINSKKIKKDGSYEFSVTNNSDKDFYFDVTMEKRKNFSEKALFSIKSIEANINMDNLKMSNDNLTIVSNVLIESKKTQVFVFTINNIEDMTFDLAINKNNDTEEYFFATIIKNNEPKKSSVTKIGEEIAATSEGLIEDTDDLGLTYYFRGSSTNNYVNFADRLWRIVRINGDGTVRLILNSVTTELTSYHAEKDGYEDFSKTTVYDALDSYYENNLKTYDKYIATSKFCTENGSTISGNNKTYNAYARIVTNKIPTLNCLGEKINSKIGLITVDEIVYAGGNTKDDNKSYYLYNEAFENNWWTSSLAKTKNGEFYPFSVTTSGKLNDEVTGTSYRELRPVINLIRKVTVTGSGTSEDPYIINS